MALMHPYGSLKVHQVPKSHNASINVFKFIRYVYLNMVITLTSSLRFLYIFDRSGLLCAMQNEHECTSCKAIFVRLAQWSQSLYEVASQTNLMAIS